MAFIQKLAVAVVQVTIIMMLAGAQAGRAEMITFMHTDYPPFTYQGNNGESTGFCIDILQAIFKKAGIEMEVKAYPWKRAEKTLRNNKNTLVFCARIERREKLYEWIGPVFPRTLSLYKLRRRSDIQIKGIEDVLGYRIGVVRGYASVNELKKIGIPEENLDVACDETMNLRKLFGNRFDLIPNNDMVLSYNLSKQGHSMNEIEKVFDITQKGGRDFHFAVNKKTDGSLIEKLRLAFDEIKKNGTYDAVRKKYIQFR